MNYILYCTGIKNQQTIQISKNLNRFRILTPQTIHGFLMLSFQCIYRANYIILPLNSCSIFYKWLGLTALFSIRFYPGIPGSRYVHIRLPSAGFRQNEDALPPPITFHALTLRRHSVVVLSSCLWHLVRN